MASPPGQPNTLDYARPAMQHGVVVESRPGEVRVVVPRASGLRVFQRVELLLLIPLGFRLWGALDQGRLPLISAALFLTVLGWWLYTVWRRRVFVVTDAEVGVGYGRGDGYVLQSRWPRQSVGEIRVNPYNGKLLIRISGQDMKEYSIGRDRQVIEYVAEALRDALTGRSNRGPAREAVADEDVV